MREKEEEVVLVDMMTNVGIYEFNAKDLIGHGAFAVVYKGRLKSVSKKICQKLNVRLRPLVVYISLNLRPGAVEGSLFWGHT